MKKTIITFVGLLFMLMLTACNEAAEPVEQEENDNEKNETIVIDEENKQSELTLEQVLNKSMEASGNINSFAMTMNLQQNVSTELQKETMNTSSSIEMKVVTDPMAFFQKINMEADESNGPHETEIYFTKDGLYFYDAVGGTWMKFPSEMSDQLVQMSGEQTNPAKELKDLQEFVDDITFEQNDNEYILKLSASGEKFNTFIQENFEQTLPPDLTDDDEIMSNTKFGDVEYEIVIDKKTYYPSKLHVSMNIEITAEGETISVKQVIDNEYSEVNQIKEITVPKEVIDQSMEVEM